MQAPPIPSNESERIADLRALHILDTPPERRFDGMVALATRVFGVPMAYVAMVDSDRQWLKAKCGIATSQTGRDVSFCGHTILLKQPLIIPDAQLDPRFHDNPLVTKDPHIRFYAGYPLAGPSGQNVGTFCLAAPFPRQLSDREMQLFSEMAELVEQELNLVDLIAAQREVLETKNRLVESQKKIAKELSEAASYVRSMLPPRIDGAVRTDWQFASSSQLGGDFFGYHWLDDQRLAVYLLDVCGHGVGAALLSVTVQNALRRGTLPDADFSDPGKVLSALNRTFPMEENNNKFFTIWYGVFDKASDTLRFCTAGHPPAVLFEPGSAKPSRLGDPNVMIGVMPNVDYVTESRAMRPGDRLYVFSDGAFEVAGPDAQLIGEAGLLELLSDCQASNGSRVKTMLDRIRAIQGTDELGDDFSLLELEFELR